MNQNDAPSRLKLLLLGLIASDHSHAASQLAGLSEPDWQMLGTMARQHRLEPLLHRQRQNIGEDWPVPAEVEGRWALAFRRSAMRALNIVQLLARLDQWLDGAGIEYAALKGAWLAQHAYGHMALRPMRDVDILVAPQDALAVFALLKGRGFGRLEGDLRPVFVGEGDSKHLPPLKCPASGISVEIHTRLIGRGQRGLATGGLSDTPALLARKIRLGGLNFLDPTDTLLHLIVHAAYDHHFDNGPLVLNDIAALVGAAKVDWGRFHAMAQTGSWGRGCQLLFSLTRRYHLAELPDCSEAADHPSDAELGWASLLLLQDTGERRTAAFHAEYGGKVSSFEKAKMIWRRAWPKPHVLMHFAGAERMNWAVRLHYPLWFAASIRRLLFAGTRRSAADNIAREVALMRWLGQD